MAELRVQVSGRTVEVTSSLYPLKMAVSPRDCRGLGDEWESPGIYILFGAPGGSIGRVYIGQARELRKRIRQHRKNMEDGTFFEWNRALLVCNTGSFGLSEIGWLEWRIHGLLEDGGVDLENKQIPGEVPLGAASQADLEVFVGVIKDALVLLGYDPEGRRQQVPTPDEATKPETTGVHRKLLNVVDSGTQIESTVPSRPATATVDDTGIRYQGDLFGSLQAAAKAITGYRTNGWAFWGVRSDTGALVRLKDLQGQTQDGPAARDTRNARGQRPRATKRDRRPSRHGDARSTTTPKKMSEATVKRLLARRDAGATHAQLQEEFRLKKGSVHRLLKKHGYVDSR